MKRFVLMLFAIALVSNLAWAATSSKSNQGILTAVSGKVQIQNKKKKKRVAKDASTVQEGERVITGADAKATLRMFDGSELKINSKTEFQVTKSEDAGGGEKVMKFKLFVGRVFASVKKLASSKSSFEVEAGGVVCGVRGTQFGLEYDPGHNHVGLGVYEGSVYTHWNGNTSFYGAGQNVNFNNGKPDNNGNNGNGGQQGNKGNKGNNGGNNPGGNALGDLSNQFTGGLTGNGNNSFTDPGVEGSVHLGVQIHVAPGEAVP